MRNKAEVMPITTMVHELKSSGLTEAIIVKELGFDSRAALRSKMSLEREDWLNEVKAEVLRLKDAGVSNNKIYKTMAELGVNWAPVHYYIKHRNEEEKKENSSK